MHSRCMEWVQFFYVMVEKDFKFEIRLREPKKCNTGNLVNVDKEIFFFALFVDNNDRDFVKHDFVSGNARDDDGAKFVWLDRRYWTLFINFFLTHYIE